MKLLAVLIVCSASAMGVEVRSPDGKVVVTCDGGAALQYAVTYDGKPVVLPSPLSLDLQDSPPLGTELTITNAAATSHDEIWRPVYGERSTVPDRYHELTLDVRENAAPGRRLRLTFRAYNEGAAFCYTVPEQGELKTVTLRAEHTHFALPKDTFGWVTPAAQGSYSRVAIPELKKTAERPLTLELPGGLVASIAEAHLTDYSRMQLALAPDGRNTLVTRLDGPVTFALPLTTPWRVIFVGERPGALIEHDYLLLDLNPPCAIADTSWIKPGKAIREVTLSTAGGKACVDFAAKHNLQYVLFDAGWYGSENNPASDARGVHLDNARHPGRELDLAAVIGYAREHGVGVFLYVNRRALERQLDEILPLYESWGIKGVKYGFVNVGSQEWTAWLYGAVAKAAEHRLMLDIHDNFRPTGFSRTWPNLLTQEGIRGNEEMPSATHNATLPFTRFVAGAADYTICYYTNRIKTTHAHQLALAVVYYSPLQLLYWYDKPSDFRGEPEVEFFDRVPTVWDETRVVRGEIGQYITTARRSGEEWFVGSITGDQPRTLDIPLSFLPAGRQFTAHIYEDSPAAGTRTKVALSKRVVDRATTIRADLAASGGQAIWISPDVPAPPPAGSRPPG